jgi:hypothetical protein
MDHTSVIVQIPSRNGWDIGSLLGYNRGEREVHTPGHIVDCPAVNLVTCEPCIELGIMAK